MGDPDAFNNFSCLPDELYMALGRLTARYGLFEYQLALTIKRLSNPPKGWNEIWDRIGRWPRATMQEKVGEAIDVEKMSQANRDGLVRVLEEADELASKRHDAVHCGWSVDRHGNVVGTRKGQAVNMTIADLNELAEKFHRLAAEITKVTSPEFVTENGGTISISSTAAASHKL